MGMSRGMSTEQESGGDATFTVVTDGPEGTARLGRALAGRLLEGDVVLLRGPLAAGKTTLVKAVVAGLGGTEAVTSPTFALAQFYDTTAGKVLHVDTYRLESLAEYRDLGLDEYYATGITLVEWGDLVAPDVVDPLVVSIEPGADPDRREIVVTGAGPRWSDVLPGLCSEVGGVPA